MRVGKILLGKLKLNKILVKKLNKYVITSYCSKKKTHYETTIIVIISNLNSFTKVFNKIFKKMVI